MSQLVREQVGGAGGETTILVEVDGGSYVEESTAADRHGGTRGGARDVVVRPFEKGMELVRSTAGLVAASMREIAETARPNEFEVEFAIKFASQVGAFIAKSGTDAQLQVRLKWVKKE